MSAPISEGYSSPRRSSGNSSIGYVPQRWLSRDSLSSFDINSSPSISEIYELQVELDYQCLQLAAKVDVRPTRSATSEVNIVVEVAIFLSGALALARFPGTFQLQETQLRALVSCLALLHYHAVEALYPTQWDKLRTNISNLFQQIAFQQQSKATLPEAIRYAPNKYLVQLVSQYLSFIRRGDSRLPSIVGPVVKIFFASAIVAGSHQYNYAQQILEGLTELCSLWQKPQRKYKALCGLQEYTRLASSLARESSDALHPKQMRAAAAMIVYALMEKICKILSREGTPSPRRLGRQWPKSRGILSLPPPNLNEGYYFLGLLDCAAQLAALQQPGELPEGFVEIVRRLIFENDVPQYRWKAIEILLSCNNTRTAQIQDLEVRIEAESSIALKMCKETLLEEVSVIRGFLDHDEEAGLRLLISQPLTIGARQPLPVNIPTDNIIPDLSCHNDVLASPHPTSENASRTSVADYSWQESELPLSRIRATKSFSVLLGGRSLYEFAGLSADCLHAFFYKGNKISVFRLPNLGIRSAQVGLPRILNLAMNITNGEPIFDVVMSRSFLVVVTSQCIRIVNISDNYCCEAVPLKEWEAGGVACYENEAHVIVALGQGRGNSLHASEGQIMLFKHVIGSRPGRLSPCSSLKLPTRDRPKRVSLDAGGTVVSCVTAIQNKLFVWELDENLTAPEGPFDYSKNHYSVERYETGISSTGLFIPPSQNRYILATTSPSSERHRNDGEWSFSLPLPPSSAPRLRPPCRAVHNFEQFRKHRPLRAGAVSNKHNIFAVMEDSGRVSFLSLAAAEEGGVCGASSDVKFVKEWKAGAGGCLSFGLDGESLVGIDAKGNGVIVDFERDD